MSLNYSLHKGVGSKSSCSHRTGSDGSDCTSTSTVGWLSCLLLDDDGRPFLLQFHLDFNLHLLRWGIVSIKYGTEGLFLGAFEVDEFIRALRKMSTEGSGNGEGSIAA